MKWIQNLINWFKGVPVKSAGRLVKNAKPNPAYAATMQQTRLVLETPNGKKWLKSLSIDELNALKKQIAKQQITPTELQKTISSGTSNKSKSITPIVLSANLVKDPSVSRLMNLKLKFLQGKELANLMQKIKSANGAHFGDFTLKFTNSFMQVINEINITIMHSGNKVGQFNAFFYTDPATGKLALQILKVEIYPKFRGQGIMRNFYRSFNQFLKTNFQNFGKFTSDYIFQYNKHTGKYDGFNMWEDLVKRGLARRTGPAEDYITPKVVPKNGLWHIKSGYELIERAVS